MKIAAFLPAKGSSERIKGKNLRLLNGKPLFLHTLEKLVECEFIDEVYLDSESDDILNYASYLNYFPLKRDKELATNKTDGHKMFYNEVRQADADIYIQILGTSPFIKKETIKKGVDILKDNPYYDSVVLVKKEKQYTWGKEQPNYNKEHIPNSIDLPDTIVETMGLYMVRSDAAHEKRQRYGDRVYLLEAEAIESVDVNFEDDFQLAERIAEGIWMEEVNKFRMLSKHLSSSLLSDILWEYGVRSSVTGLNLNIKNSRIMGRANTLKIRRLRENEDFHGIYDGLCTYKEIRNGEIICVENECPEYAYFGELNANLAIRCGAVGTIVDGVTRDIHEVTQLGYPVFSKGYCCTDVRGTATVESHNQEIRLGGIKILPGSIIFADANGVVMIPGKLEQEVLNRALESMKTEKSVLNRIILGEEAFSIHQKEGAF